jgi:hypothetical protein
VVRIKYLRWVKGIPDGIVTNPGKSVVGLRPSFSSHVRWGERGAPVDCLRGCYDGLGGFVGDVGLDGVLHELAPAVERQLFFDMRLVGFDGFYAEV